MGALRADTKVQFLKGIGARRAEAFARLGVFTAQDLLWHLPHRYIDASQVTPLAQARVGDDVACVGQVVDTGIQPTRRGLKIFRAVLRDSSGLLECAWPGQPFLERSIKPGQTLLVAGTVRFYHGRQLSPREFVILAEGGAEAEESGPGSGTVLPVYPATEGLSHKQIRGLVQRHLDALVALQVDDMPEALRSELGLPGVRQALRAVHQPASLSQAEEGRRRLAFDELFDLQLMLVRARLLAKRQRAGVSFEIRRDLTTKLKERLPFTLTGDQVRAVREITDDMTSPERMHRLLMGDVGTGKTVVALFAMLLAVENGYQAALMAPTELLAEQHAATLQGLLRPLGITPEVLMGRLTAAEKSAARARLSEGRSRVVVGTHALMQESVSFRRLGLAVIDEQHRFGVEQRAALIAKGATPDVLLLSATPIPRSLALTMYGDLDMSVLRESPPGRGDVRTVIRSGRQRRSLPELLLERCSRGEQAYVVLPVIEESERADLRAATSMAETLSTELADLTIGLVHGRMKPDERDAIMRRFRAGEIHVLVATTVIEVGIDVANATTMVIHHPERFGLAQLHQLRGRVGRGGVDSVCVLVADGTVPSRLEGFAGTTDGFRIAELDLAERGMGDLIGARQSGGFVLRHATLPEDAELLERARKEARGVLETDPGLTAARHQSLKARAVRRYPRAAELFRVG